MSKTVQQRAVLLQVPKNDKLDLEFDSLCYTVRSGKVKKEVLRSISGKFKSGELTAIMGPSGAGKSSLLNILTGFQTTNTTGSIRCTGQQEKDDGKVKYKKDSCYILQDDRLCPLFKVSEIMNMAAKLKIGNSVSDSSKKILISEILQTLGLENTLETRCGRLSGGQKKRLSIALELIDNPPIMFLDEPTTGLDSSSSLQCISMLKTLARGGRTVVCTIHQPSATIYEMFDHVYVLAEGNCIYQGGSKNTVPFLSSVGLYCPQYHNPADHIIEVANGEYGNYTDILVKVARESNWRTVEEPNKVLPNTDNVNKTMVLVQQPSEYYRFGILLRRNILQLYRDWTVTHLKLGLHILVGIFVGLLYFNYGNNGEKSVSNSGFFLISATYLSYTSMMPAILRFPQEVPVIKKESFNNWYALRTYYMAYLVSSIPLQILFAVTFTSISYYITGQPLELDRYLMFVTIAALVTLTAEGIGIILGTIVNPVNGTFFGAILTALLLVVAGFLMLFSHMSRPMYAISYISYLAYGLEAQVQAIYGFNRAPLICPEDITYCHFKSPATLLKEFGMEKNNYWYDVMFLIGNIVFTKIVGFCTLRKVLKTT